MILCCGEALIDFLPRQGADGAAVYQPVNGGSVYNTAIALGRLGVPVGFFAGISTDFFGDALLQGLSDSKVGLKYIRKKPHHTTLAFVKLEAGHARYSFIDDASAGRNLVKADLPKLTKDVAALHFGSISLIPEPEGSTYEALQKREAKARVISIDPNIRPSQIKDRKKHLARLARMMALADIVKISDEDVQWMTGKTDFANAAKKWLKAGAKVVAITGAASVSRSSPRGSRSRSPPPRSRWRIRWERATPSPRASSATCNVKGCCRRRRLLHWTSHNSGPRRNSPWPVPPSPSPAPAPTRRGRTRWGEGHARSRRASGVTCVWDSLHRSGHPHPAFGHLLPQEGEGRS